MSGLLIIFIGLLGATFGVLVGAFGAIIAIDSQGKTNGAAIGRCGRIGLVASLTGIVGLVLGLWLAITLVEHIGSITSGPGQILPQPTLTTHLTTATPPAPSRARILSTTFKTFAVLPWQNTGIQVRTGDLLQINYVSGRWTGRKEDEDYTGPDAGPTVDNASCFSMPPPVSGRNALIGKIGTGNPFKVGYHFGDVSSVDGVLYLRMNDCDQWLSDNHGHVIVSIELSR